MPSDTSKRLGENPQNRAGVRTSPLSESGLAKNGFCDRIRLGLGLDYRDGQRKPHERQNPLHDQRRSNANCICIYFNMRELGVFFQYCSTLRP